MAEIVNIVGSGQIEQKLDLVSLNSDIGFPIAKYDPEMYHGMYIQFDDDNPLITVYDSGKYIIVGSRTFDQLQETRQNFLELLVKQNRLSKPSDSWFKVQNIVGSDNLGQELDLNELVITLGLENAEYEPEQFPGIVYQDQDNDCVILIFRTGKIVVTGAKSKESVEKAVQKIRDILVEE